MLTDQELSWSDLGLFRGTIVEEDILLYSTFFGQHEVPSFWIPRSGREALGGVGKGLRGSGGVRRVSWEALGRSWSGLESHLAARQHRVSSGTIMGSIRAPVVCEFAILG